MNSSQQRRNKSVIQKTKDYKKALPYKNENYNKMGVISRSKSPRDISVISSDNHKEGGGISGSDAISVDE
jgi:hypothetical protein